MKPTLLFDADGVIINAKMFSHHLEAEHGITQEQTKDFFTGVFVDCLEGRADLRVEIEPYLSRWGWKGDVDDFLSFWFEAFRIKFQNSPLKRLMKKQLLRSFPDLSSKQPRIRVCRK